MLSAQEAEATFRLLFIVLTITGFTVAILGSYLIWREWLREPGTGASVRWVTDISKVPDPEIQRELREFDRR